MADNEKSDQIPPTFLLNIFTTMVMIRRFEETVARLISAGRILCPCHLYIGQEAVASGVCAALGNDDWVFSTHRSHGHFIAKGGNIRSMMAELFGKETGCSRGHGGSMHIADPKKGLPGSSAIVAGTISLAVGAGLAFNLRKKNSISVAFFGDGATNEGGFFESLNFASLHKIPMIFVCENNLYSTHMPIDKCLSNTRICEIAKAFKISSIRVDGNNSLDVYQATIRGIERIRAGQGPIFIECMTYRWLGHVGQNDDIGNGLRTQTELDSWIARCPIENLWNYLIFHGFVAESQRKTIYEQVDIEIQKAVEFAESSSYPDPADTRSHATIYKER